MKALALGLLAVLAVFAATSPALESGFLADDFYVGQQIATRARQNPGIVAAIGDAFAHRWSPTFELFRPLTFLTIQADHALHGADGGRHHLTNLFAWIAASLVFASLLGHLSGRRDPLTFALSILLFGLHPAAVESLGWLVARSDILLALFGMLAFRALVVHRTRPWIATLWMVPAYLCSEASVVLAPTLLWFDAVRLGGWGSRGSVGTRAAPLLRRHLPSLLLLAGYFSLRLALFGSIGSTYNNESYGAYLAKEGVIGRIADAVGHALLMLTTPFNRSMLAAGDPATPEWIAVLACVVPLLVAVALGLRHRRTGDLRILVAVLPWTLGPVLMLSPLFHVETTLEESRIITWPLCGYLVAVGLFVHRGLAGRPRLALPATVILLAVLAAAMQLDLGAYVEAGRRAERVVEDLRAVPVGQRVVLLRSDHPDNAGPLGIYRGAYVLSAGINHATFPPFREAPGVHPDPIPTALEAELARYITPGLRSDGIGDRPEQRPVLATCVLEGDAKVPRVRVLALGGFHGTCPELTPRHGTRHPTDRPLDFGATGPVGSIRGATTIRLIVTEAGGRTMPNEFPATPPILTTDGDRYTVQIPGERLAPIPLTPAVMPELKIPVLIWWIEIADGDEVLVRSPYAVFNLDS